MVAAAAAAGEEQEEEHDERRTRVGEAAAQPGRGLRRRRQVRAGERERDACRQRGVDARVVDLGGGAMASWTCASTANIRSAVGVATGKKLTSAMPSALSLGRQ